jgi:hypothetical protein
VQLLQQKIVQEKQKFSHFVKEVTTSIGIHPNDVVQTTCNNTWQIKHVHIMQVLDDVPAEPTDKLELLIYGRRQVKRTGQWSRFEDFCLLPIQTITHVNNQPFNGANHPLFI